MRTDRIENKVLIEELSKARAELELVKRAASQSIALLSSQGNAARAQRDALRIFADRVDHVVGIGRLMLEAGMPVRGDFVLSILDEALEAVCKATGGVRTPMREGMTAAELAEASASFRGASGEGGEAGGSRFWLEARAREESLVDLARDQAAEKAQEHEKTGSVSE
jgi:hypothetical protein